MTPTSWIDLPELAAFIEVVIIDVTLAGDNALVVGMAAAALPQEHRRQVLMMGIGVATVFRIGFALIIAEFLDVIGLTLAGGLLLLWVCWTMYREARSRNGESPEIDADSSRTPRRKSRRRAMLQIVVADVSMSLDNVLAVAGTARDHFWILVAGLVLSVALMGAASTVIARLLRRFPWIIWLGLAIVTYVALTMIHQGWSQVSPHLLPLGSVRR